MPPKQNSYKKGAETTPGMTPGAPQTFKSRPAQPPAAKKTKKSVGPTGNNITKMNIDETADFVDDILGGTKD